MRYTSGTTPTTYRYTGQREEASFGLYYYNARWYDPQLGRFAQADTIVPGGVQGLDRYAYVNNNPVKYNDPSGHMWVNPDGRAGGGKYSNSTQDILDASQINVETLNNRDKYIVTRAAQAVANALGSVSNSMSAWMTFRYFLINGGRNLSFDYWINNNTYSQAGGNAVTNQLTITMPKNIYSLYYGNSTGKAIRNMVHEFGHAFEDSVGFYEGTNQWNSSLADKYSKISAEFSRKDYGSFFGNDYWGFAGGQNNWQFTRPGDGFGQFIEVFADMFLGFTYNSWGTSDLAKQRSAWMTDIMTYYSNVNP